MASIFKKMRLSSRLGLLTLIALAFSSPVLAEICDDPAGTTIYLVRHAEKQDGPDPALTAEGLARAEALRKRMAEIPLDAIHVTQWQRTRLTAAPLAEERGIEMRVHSTAVGSLAEHVQSVVDTLMSQHCGENVLVVGHSNTVPKIITGLTGQHFDDLDEREYDRFYQVGIRPEGPAEVFRTRFGAANHVVVE